MNDQSKEQLRERLLGDEEARAAISQRAYEIYQQRGGEPGLELTIGCKRRTKSSLLWLRKKCGSTLNRLPRQIRKREL